MHRLTYRSRETSVPPSYACSDVQCKHECDNCNINKLIQRLCEYEDTGMTPEEIADLRTMKRMGNIKNEARKRKII